MEKTTTTLSPNGLATLLALGKEVGDTPEEDNALGLSGELLAVLLARKLSLEKTDSYAPCCVLRRSCEELRQCAGRSLRDTILSRGTDLPTLMTLKNYGKTLVRAAESEPEKAASTAIYYAAIAAALVYHQQRITSLPDPQLSDGLSVLAAKVWIPDELKALYRKARDVCQG
jgi:hypothetical protein